MESMAKIIKKLSNNVIDLKKMDSKNTSRKNTKPYFRWYGNPATNKTITPAEETHFGQWINFMRLNNTNPDDIEETGRDPKANANPSNEDNTNQDPFQETSINMLWDIEDANEKPKEIHAYHTWSKGVLIPDASIPTTTSYNVQPTPKRVLATPAVLVPTPSRVDPTQLVPKEHVTPWLVKPTTTSTMVASFLKNII